MLERTGELGALERALSAVGSSRGTVLWFTGPPGIGKSALLEAARRLAAADGITVCAASGRELEHGYPFGSALQLFEPVVRGLGEPGREALFAGAAARARPLLAPHPDDHRLVAGEVFDLVHGLYWLVANLADTTPLLLLVDDLQWVDTPSLRFLHYLAGRVGDLPVALVGAVRPAPAPGAELEALLGHDAAAVLALEPLSPAAVSELLGGGMPPADAETFHRLTAGNPLLVHELIENLAAVRALDQAEATEGGGAVLPTVVSRVGRLPADARVLAQACAVVGTGGRLAVAAAAAGLSVADALLAAPALIDGAVLAREDPIEFVHPLVASSILDTVDPAEAARLRAAVAGSLDEQGAPPEVVAAHLVDALPSGSAHSVGVLRRAARRALRTGSPDNAARWLRRAVQEGGVGPADQGALLIELANAAAAAGDAAWRDHLEAGLGRVGTPESAAQELLRVSGTLQRLGDLDRASELAWRGIELLGETESDLALRLLAAYGTAAAVDLQARGRALARIDAIIGDRLLGSSPPERALLALLAYEHAIAGGAAGAAAVSDVAELARRAVTADGAGGDGAGPAPPQLFMALLALQWCDELALAESVLNGLRDEARREGDVVGLASTANFLAPVHLLCCRAADAAADAESAAEGFEVGWRVSAPGAAGNLALARLELGDVTGAAAALDLPDRTAHWIGGASYNFLLFATGSVRLAEGRYEEAIDALLECGRRQDRMGSVNPMVMPWRSVAATALALSGRGEEADELWRAELALAQRFGAPRAIAAARRVGAVVGPAAERPERLQEALAVAEQAPSTLERVRIQVALGAALRRQGARAAAREPLRQALQTAEEGGALALAERARAELAATGAKPRRLAVTGPAALTPSERRVASLAARGRKNRQIAEELFVSVKAVEYHLGNAFRKLGVSRREDLPGILSESLSA